MSAARRLAAPRRARVVTGPGGRPAAIGGVRVESVLEDWLVEDRWWTGRPRRRRYLEVVLASGSCIVLFLDLSRGGWFIQRG